MLDDVCLYTKQVAIVQPQSIIHEGASSGAHAPAHQRRPCRIVFRIGDVQGSEENMPKNSEYRIIPDWFIPSVAFVKVKAADEKIKILVNYTPARLTALAMPHATPELGLSG
ncbi:hypothetical protein MRX96_050210 [Rhipicephalus microplus]